MAGVIVAVAIETGMMVTRGFIKIPRPRPEAAFAVVAIAAA